MQTVKLDLRKNITSLQVEPQRDNFETKTAGTRGVKITSEFSLLSHNSGGSSAAEKLVGWCRSYCPGRGNGILLKSPRWSRLGTALLVRSARDSWRAGSSTVSQVCRYAVYPRETRISGNRYFPFPWNTFHWWETRIRARRNETCLDKSWIIALRFFFTCSNLIFPSFFFLFYFPSIYIRYFVNINPTEDFCILMESYEAICTYDCARYRVRVYLYSLNLYLACQRWNIYECS